MDNMNEWIDNPVIQILLYFEGLQGSYFRYAILIARVLFLASLVWGGIQLALGTLEARKYVIENVVHLFCFLLILHMFPAFSQGLFKFSNGISKALSGKSISEAEYTLNQFYKKIDELAKELTNKENGKWVKQKDKLITKIKQMDSEIQELEDMEPSYDDLGTSYIAWQNDLETKKVRRAYAENKKEQLQNQIDNYKNSVSVLGVTLNALESVLVETKKNSYGEETRTNLTSRYNRKLNLSTNVNGVEIISPAAMLKVMMFSTGIMFEKAWSGSDSGGKSKWKKVIDNMNPGKISELIMTTIVCIFSIAMGCCILIQYVMCIIEYMITSGISILIVPCLLFDGLKDMVNKILPSLLAQALKLIMINLCMFFALSQFLRLAMKALTLDGGVNFQTMAYIIFSLLLTFALSVNAPKIAATLMTGSPQMSMGEFVQAAAAAAGGAAAAYHGVNTLQRGIETGSKWAANRIMGSANRIGDLKAMGAAGSEASRLARADGRNGFVAGLKGAGAAIGEGGYIAKTRLAKGFSDWAHSGSSGGGKGGRGGASGESKFSYGIDAAKLQNTEYNKSDQLGKHAMDFGDAMNYDKYGNATTRQTMGEYVVNRAEDARRRARENHYTPIKRNVTPRTNDIVPVNNLHAGGKPPVRNITPPGLVPTKRRNKIAPNNDD